MQRCMAVVLHPPWRKPPAARWPPAASAGGLLHCCSLRPAPPLHHSPCPPALPPHEQHLCSSPSTPLKAPPATPCCTTPHHITTPIHTTRPSCPCPAPPGSQSPPALPCRALPARTRQTRARRGRSAAAGPAPPCWPPALAPTPPAAQSSRPGCGRGRRCRQTAWAAGRAGGRSGIGRAAKWARRPREQQGERSGASARAA